MVNKIVWYFIVGSLFLLIIFLLNFSHIRQTNEINYVGIPDGAAGLLARYVLDKKMEPHTIHSILFEPYTLYDCCASATQYAMGSGRLDIAIMCPEAAQELVARDDRFEIAGPVMLNSDILITRQNADLHQPSIGVSQKREFQRQMVFRQFGTKSSAVPMLHAAVPFAYARGVIQGAVIDITKAFNLKGEITSASVHGQDICTYVLVNKKSLLGSNQYHHFLEIYAEAVREMDNPHNLLRLLQNYVSVNITVGDVEKWKKMNVRFTYPFKYPRQE
ncbi:MAG: ABC transporter substrate-binding (seleno)protein SaoB [Desulforhopalus sp.]